MESERTCTPLQRINFFLLMFSVSFSLISASVFLIQKFLVILPVTLPLYILVSARINYESNIYKTRNKTLLITLIKEIEIHINSTDVF